MSDHDLLCGGSELVCICDQLRQARKQERERMAAAIENLPAFEEADEWTTVLLSDVRAAFEEQGALGFPAGVVGVAPWLVFIANVERLLEEEQR
jgi:hypothetical protein